MHFEHGRWPPINKYLPEQFTLITTLVNLITEPNRPPVQHRLGANWFIDIRTLAQIILIHTHPHNKRYTHFLIPFGPCFCKPRFVAHKILCAINYNAQRILSNSRPLNEPRHPRVRTISPMLIRSYEEKHLGYFRCQSTIIQT